MVKAFPMSLKKEEINKIIDVSRVNEFDYMIFMVLKTTGRRIGELYGTEDLVVVSRKIVGKRLISIEGRPTEIDKTIPVYRKTNVWKYGVKVKDIDFEAGTMKVWVLKRRAFIQDETILSPEVLSIIRAYIKKNKLGLESYLFRKKGRSIRQMQNVIKTYSKAAGVETEAVKNGVRYSLSLHSFRHYFITELKRAGWTNDEISKLTGHKSVGTLSIYDHIVAADIKDKALGALKEL